MRAQHVSTLLLIAVAVTHDSVTYGANCALRNPDRQVYEMFPQASSYRSIVASVDNEVKKSIEGDLGSKISVNDLGKHTAYIVLKDKAPIGFIHARSELGKLGTVELIWALDLDLRVIDFRLQRSREKHSAVVRSDEFRTKLIGRDVGGLQTLLTHKNQKVDLNALNAPAKAESICHTAVLCGVKCVLITEKAFSKQVLNGRLLGNVYRLFPRTAKVSKLSRSASSDYPLQSLDADSTLALRSVGRDDQTVGILLYSRWINHPNKPEIWWGVREDGTVQNVIVVGSIDHELRSGFYALAGKKLSDLEAESNEQIGQCLGDVGILMKQFGL